MAVMLGIDGLAIVRPVGLAYLLVLASSFIVVLSPMRNLKEGLLLSTVLFLCHWLAVIVHAFVWMPLVRFLTNDADVILFGAVEFGSFAIPWAFSWALIALTAGGLYEGVRIVVGNRQEVKGG